MANVDKNPRKNVPHHSIFDYWKDKVILNNGDIKTISESFEKISPDEYVRVIYDWGEPCCWGCDKPIIGKYEENRESTEDVDFQKVWNDKYVARHLNRCHIVPRTLGGEDVPDNLFLMCKDCHEKSPDTVNSGSFFRWVYDQRKTHTFGAYKPQIVFERVQEILSRRGLDISIEDLANAICDRDLSYESFKKYMSQHIETHEFRYSETSMFEGYVDWLVHNYVDACLESVELLGIID